MEQQKIDRLKEINKRILECRECTFHQDISKQNLSYRPDAPCFEPNKLKDAQFKVLSVGLNPGWSEIQNAMERKTTYQELYKMPIASDDDYEKYVWKLSKMWDDMPKGRQPYKDALAKTLDIINKKMGIYDGITYDHIKADLYEKYLFWANLSFCNSQNVNERSFWGKKDISCNVLSEEIPNCLDKGFLRDIMNCLKPELVIFFGSSYALHPKVIVRKLTGITSDKIIYEKKLVTAHKRKNKNGAEIEVGVKVEISLCDSNETNTKFLFLPHPSYRWISEYREAAIDWACSKLMAIK